MPAKLEATPEKVVNAVRTPREPAQDGGIGDEKAEDAAAHSRDQAGADRQPIGVEIKG